MGVVGSHANTRLTFGGTAKTFSSLLVFLDWEGGLRAHMCECV